MRKSNPTQPPLSVYPLQSASQASAPIQYYVASTPPVSVMPQGIFYPPRTPFWSPGMAPPVMTPLVSLRDNLVAMPTPSPAPHPASQYTSNPEPSLMSTPTIVPTTNFALAQSSEQKTQDYISSDSEDEEGGKDSRKLERSPNNPHTHPKGISSVMGGWGDPDWGYYNDMIDSELADKVVGTRAKTDLDSEDDRTLTQTISQSCTLTFISPDDAETELLPENFGTIRPATAQLHSKEQPQIQVQTDEIAHSGANTTTKEVKSTPANTDDTFVDYSNLPMFKIPPPRTRQESAPPPTFIARKGNSGPKPKESIGERILDFGYPSCRKRPINGFMAFTSFHRHMRARKGLKVIRNDEFLRRMSKMWNEMSGDDQYRFKILADRLTSSRDIELTESVKRRLSSTQQPTITLLGDATPVDNMPNMFVWNPPPKDASDKIFGFE